MDGNEIELEAGKTLELREEASCVEHVNATLRREKAQIEIEGDIRLHRHEEPGDHNG
jgi:hypothetical protein